MGACDISFDLDKKATRSEIETVFKKQVQADRITNGNGSYSGDFQTVDKVDFSHLGQVFRSQHEAMEYCLNKAQKWVTVVAVYYADVDVKSTSLTKLNEQLKELHVQIETLDRIALARNKAFITCPNCKSKISLKHHTRGNKCLACHTDLRPKSLTSRIAKLRDKAKALNAKRDDKIKLEVDKALAKLKDSQVKTLVAGWGAC